MSPVLQSPIAGPARGREPARAPGTKARLAGTRVRVPPMVESGLLPQACLPLMAGGAADLPGRQRDAAVARHDIAAPVARRS